MKTIKLTKKQMIIVLSSLQNMLKLNYEDLPIGHSVKEIEELKNILIYKQLKNEMDKYKL